jgi:hypothetical protein
MSRLALAIEQLEFARKYSLRLLDHVKEEDWFRQPPGGVTHIGWQVGHLATAEYRMCLDRIRGPRPEDEALISQEFIKLFGKNSLPVPDTQKYPSQKDIRAVLDRVHQQTILELPKLTEQDLDSPVTAPHSLIQTKLWALIWCAQHEGVHAGQIGLLRRQLGYPPIW